MDEPIFLSYRWTLDVLTESLVDWQLVYWPSVRRFEKIFFSICLLILVSMLGLAVVVSQGPPARHDLDWLVVFTAVGFVVGLLLIGNREKVNRGIYQMILARQFKNSPMIDAQFDCWVSEAGFVYASTVIEGRYGWEMVKRIGETRRCFIIVMHSYAYSFAPSRAFRCREDIDRFIALARAKSPKYDVIQPIEYAPGLDETPAPLQEW